MEDELRELKARLAGMSNEELLKIVTVERGDYRREAIELATRELQSRGVEFDPSADVEDEDDEESGATISGKSLLPCELCGGAMRVGQMFADRELTIFFPDDDEERFIQAIACNDCGHVRLLVDFETEIEEER
ncbi:MAG TPA: hypothetical protein VNS63_08390 [Blastocatellia bacterium]|nr:hypothetical protein [Blastocatellia bacterium]